MTFWNWEKKTSEPEKPAQKPPTVKEFEKMIDEVKDAVDDLQRKIDPKRQRVRESVERHKQGVGTTPELESPELREKNDEEAARTSKKLAAESQSYARQTGESAEDHFKRVELLKERELRNKMSGAEVMAYDYLKAKMAKDDLLSKNPFPAGKIVLIEDDRYVCQFESHPNLPRKQMTGDMLVVRQVMRPYTKDNEPRLEHAKGEVGMSGTLRSFTDGLAVTYFFVVSAA